MLPHHQRTQEHQHRDLPLPLHASAGAATSTMAGTEPRWRGRLGAAVLALPATLPLFAGYLIVAVPLALLASLIVRRNVLGLAFKLLRAAPLDMFWFPFWRVCTSDGRHRYEYVDMRTGDEGLPYRSVQGRAVRCTVDGLPEQPPNCARLVLLSDTHGKHDWVDVPNGDVLCHTGDITVGWRNRCSCCRANASLRAFDAWLGDLPHRHKVIIGGNHDSELERIVATERSGDARPFTNATYLENSGKMLQLPRGRTLHVWGTPWSAAGNSANQAFRARSVGKLNPPLGVDVLLSHSKLSSETLERAAPRVHASGHFHDSHGVNLVHGEDEAAGGSPSLSEQAADLYGPAGATKPFAPPPGQTARCDVNAAVCDSSYSTTQRVIVVDLPVATPQQAAAAVPTGGVTAAPAAAAGRSIWGLGRLLSRLTE
jgi:hypothetical protein